jgi:hypothetical protein
MTMDNILQLFGTLILTLLGFALPILSIAIAMLPEGVSCLLSKYENEKKQSEENLLNETQKKNTDADLDYKQLEKTIKILKKNKNDAIKKLSYLDPTKLILRISIPFILSLIILSAALVTKESYPKVLLLFSTISFVAGLIALWKTVVILIEVSSAVNQKNKSYEDKLVQLLSTIAEKGGSEHLFLKDGEITAKFNGKLLKKDEKFEFAANKPYEIPVSINNSGEFMAKNVEVGFIFPKDFLIDKTSNISLYPNETSQIVRLNNNIVQAHENFQKE